MKGRHPNSSSEFFDEVYSMYVNKVETFVYYYVYDKDTASELAQEVFVSFLENIDNIDRNGNILSYLLQSAKNAVLKYFRKRTYGREYSDYKSKITADISVASIDAFPFYDISVEEISGLLTSAYSRMPEKTREAFVMNRLYGKKYSEIAEQQGVTVKNVEYRIMSALKILRIVFRDYIKLVVLLYMTRLS